MCSLYLMGDSSQMNRVEREEMKRRTLTMLLYLLRSPFYDRYSKLVTFHTQLECTYTLAMLISYVSKLLFIS